MNLEVEQVPVTAVPEVGEIQPMRRKPSRRLAWFAIVVLGLSLGYGRVLFDWARFALGSELFSHMVLIPAVSAFLIWLRRGQLPSQFRVDVGLAAIPIAFGAFSLATYWIKLRQGWEPNMEDYLFLTVLSYCCFLVAGGFLVWGRHIMRKIVFPVAFLVFMIPFPTFFTNWTEIFFQRTSAIAAHWLLAATTTPLVVYNGLVFKLPGITIQVGQECSGIHSSLVLLITSLLAGQLFLVTTWKRAGLALFVIPLAIVRNAVRIFTIAMLCVYDDPAWIDSALHHQGGPFFFILSLIPFFLLLVYLRKTEPASPALKATAS